MHAMRVLEKGGYMRRKQNKATNTDIVDNEKDAHDGELNGLVWELYWWFAFFNIVFFKDQLVPTPFITFERTNVTNLSHYVAGRNAFGVKENININRAHLNRPLWDILATLLHEMVHSWQALFGNPSNSWFHNKEFQKKMDQFGIYCNGKGGHTGISDPFVFLLKKHGVQFTYNKDDDGTIKIPLKPKGKSKLKKWQCHCGQSVRVGAKDFFATCDLCNGEFQKAGENKTLPDNSPHIFLRSLIEGLFL